MGQLNAEDRSLICNLRTQKLGLNMDDKRISK